MVAITIRTAETRVMRESALILILGGGGGYFGRAKHCTTPRGGGRTEGKGGSQSTTAGRSSVSRWGREGRFGTLSLKYEQVTSLVDNRSSRKRRLPSTKNLPD